jgi:DNA-binding response OmpR family regulator
MLAHVLLVDDDALLRRSASLRLEQAGYRTTTAGTAENALEIARRDPPDIVLLDIGLPGMDGLTALRQFEQRLAVPVIFVSARRREIDQVIGLELGADDYITKPFDFDVLLAHVKAVLRRTKRPAPMVREAQAALVVGDITIDPGAHVVMVDDRKIELTRREFDLLHVLALQPGHVVSVEDLLARVWGAEFEGESQVVYVHVRWLREKLEEDPDHPRRLVTVRGVGYKLASQGMGRNLAEEG